MDRNEKTGRTPEEKRRIDAMIARYQKKKRKRRIIRLAVLLIFAVSIYSLYSVIRPPQINTQPNVTTSPETENIPENTEPVYEGPERKEDFYTFVVVGNDDGNGNTDTILIGAYDNKNNKLSMVSIPRDTIVNVSWSPPKINSLFARSDDGIQGLKEGIRDICGFPIDNYFVVDMEAFSAVVDAIGGVEFDVPIDMDYEDPVQDLYIHIKAGYQHLDGEHALQVVRFRSGYALQDIGRIETQQAFLKAAAKKCLNIGNVFKINEFARIFSEHVETDLDIWNIIWYAQELLGLSEESISLQTMPTRYDEYINGTSYCSIIFDEWMRLINSDLNPYTEEITTENVNIVTRDSDGNLYATSGEILGDIA